MPPVGFEPTISAGERPQTYALDRAATGTGTNNITRTKYIANIPNIKTSKSYTNAEVCISLFHDIVMLC